MKAAMTDLAGRLGRLRSSLLIPGLTLAAFVGVWGMGHAMSHVASDPWEGPDDKWSTGMAMVLGLFVPFGAISGPVLLASRALRWRVIERWRGEATGRYGVGPEELDVMGAFFE